jgi:hypothetical protein
LEACGFRALAKATQDSARFLIAQSMSRRLQNQARDSSAATVIPKDSIIVGY